jgi:hypothetical protein
LFAGAAFAVYENKIATTQNSPEPSAEAQTQETASPPIIIEVYTPHVFIKTPDQTDFEEITSSKNVPAGTIVKTDSVGRAQAIYPNHSVTRLDHNSEFKIEDFNQNPFKAEVKLSKGKIWSRVAKLLGQETYETKSQNLVASIRGTSFGHNIMENGQDTIMVTEGKVNGDCIKIEQGSDVATGQKASYPCSQGGPISQKNMTNTEKKDEWYLFNQAEDKKLDEKYGLGTYTDVLGATPTPKPTKTPTPLGSPKPTATAAQPTSNNSPTSNPTNSPTPSPTPTPTPDPGPTANNFNASPSSVCSRLKTFDISFRADIMILR